MAWPSEIFYGSYNKQGKPPDNATAAELDTNFFGFRAWTLRTRPDLSYPDFEARRALFDSYLDYLREFFETDRLLIDIKYNSWHHLDGLWRFRRILQD
jgi:hypothetical protein